MPYDFDTPINRRDTNSLKWNVAPSELPMWVADMDFAAPDVVREALQRKLDTGVYGYQVVPEAFGRAVADWWRTRHGWAVQPDWVIFVTGVVPAVTSCVRRLTHMGDNVAIFTPVYDIFFHSIENSGRHTLACPLVYSGGRYHIDWADLEAKLAHPNTTLMLLCNPHNPTGQVWSPATLMRIGRLCRRYGVTVLSDEIHCDLTLPAVDYVPFASLPHCAANTVVCVSASKAFNLAGLQGAAVIVPDPILRQRVNRALNADEVAEPNAFAIEGTIAALTRGADWLDALRRYLAQNRDTVGDFLAQHAPRVHIVPQQATYLMWLDVSAYCTDSTALCDHIRRTTGLFVTAGGQYAGNGSRFVRLNIACPRVTLLDGLQRLAQGIATYQP